MRCCAMSDEVLWNVVMLCGMTVGEYGGELWCKMWNAVVEYRVMWNGLTPFCVVWCGMMVEMRQCGMCGVVWNVLWNSVMCNFIFECDVHGVVRGGMWAWCDLMVCPDVVEWFDVNYGAMRNVMCNAVRCGMLQFQTWCDWNAKCVRWNMAWCGMWCHGMWNVA